VFLHAVREGPANRSYGLAVAKLAGVPVAVIAAARRYLATLEAQRDAVSSPSPQGSLPFGAPPLPPPPDALRERLGSVEPDTLSPREAHALLYELRGLLDREA
jgi:DNA mismatch repair protein MutS